MSTLTAPYVVEDVRKEFPILCQRVHGSPLAYLDNAATTQRPMVVVEAIKNYYLSDNANVHRSVHELAHRSTEALEGARQYVQHWIGARHAHEVIFTRGTTEAINLVASSWGQRLVPGDEIIISAMEHHSNLVPWQLAAARYGAKLRIIPLHENETLDLEAAKALFNEKTRLLAVGHASNALGRIHPIEKLISYAKGVGACVLIDGAQALAHLAVDVSALDVDFYVFSAHKAYGPMGIGALYGKEALLEEMPPYQSGGEMIKDVSFDKVSFNSLPHKFEAGTPNVAAAVGWHASLQWIADRGGYDVLASYENTLTAYAENTLSKIDGLRLYAVGGEKVPICAFSLDGVHSYDVAQLLDARGIAVRSGHHCAQPLMQCLGISGCLRASLACYNTEDEINRLAEGLLDAIRRLR